MAFLTGCAVPQPRGNGRLTHVIEPTTSRGYWLYLPQRYLDGSVKRSQAERWPLVVTFHGMSPFDTAGAQAREWEAEADRYNFIVVAPELRSLNVLSEFPVRHVHSAFAADERATLLIMEHVFETTRADREHVLATSFSSGGYMAHYMLNRHPEAFTCLGVRQSNFSDSVLDETAAPASRTHPVLIVTTQNDLAICRRESMQAVDWYKRHNYTQLAWLSLKGLGHERTPDLVAAFFGRVSGQRPANRPTVLARRQVEAGEFPSASFFAEASGAGL